MLDQFVAIFIGNHLEKVVEIIKIYIKFFKNIVPGARGGIRTSKYRDYTYNNLIEKPHSMKKPW